MKRFLAFACLLTLPALAELPPTAYRDMRDKAPDVVTLDLKSVRCTPLTGDGLAAESCTVALQGKVLKVVRSKHGLKPGDTVKLSYQHLIHTGGWAGPRPMPVLVQGQQTPAFLEKDAAGKWQPAAQGGSFQND